jgi:MotA/TolQ/ExbB proton channel family
MMSKALVEHDFVSLRRLERTRILVRAGPALGLMGTLIPLSPALAGLAAGDVQELSENLRVAFSVTVIGLLIGAIAFGISLVRDRLYSQDLSDLEFVANRLTSTGPLIEVSAPEEDKTKDDAEAKKDEAKTDEAKTEKTEGEPETKPEEQPTATAAAAPASPAPGTDKEASSS